MKKFRIILTMLLVFSGTLFILQSHNQKTTVTKVTPVDVTVAEPILEAHLDEVIEETRQRLLLAENDWKPVSPFAK